MIDPGTANIQSSRVQEADSPTATPPTPAQGVRVIYQQPACPKYRLPVYDELASRPGINLTVVYADEPDLENAASGRAWSLTWPKNDWTILGQRLTWHGAQWHFASRQRTDVLLLTWNTRYLSLVPSLIRARLTGVPTILWGHGYSKAEGRLRRLARGLVARLATCVQVYNHTTARRLVNEGFSARRVHVALNALDQRPMKEASEHWRSRPDRLVAFAQEKGIAPGPLVLFVSRLMDDNRVDLLIEALARLRESGRLPTLRAAIVGKGPDEGRLRALAEARSIGHAVHFAGAIYDERELAPYFLCADVFCYPANIGLSILHAFGYGLPVVTADSIEAQNPEIEALRPGENGLLYRAGDVDDLADALARIIEDKALRVRMSEAALKTVTERFTLANMVDGMVGAIACCVEETARGR